MSPSSLFAAALHAAGAVCAAQSLPHSSLYLVATPIGNLADIGLRALHVLQQVDALACEDTRHTQQLLRSYGMPRPASALIALHQHNEAQASSGIVARLRAGQRIAYVSDAGTPAISDPGARLCAAVQAAGLRCIPLPGASSVTAALSAAGASVDGFVFAGFLPAKAAARAAAVQALALEARCTVLLEAPHRIRPLAAQLAGLGERPVTVAREISKQFEEIATLGAQDLPAWLDAAPQRARGEFVLVLHPLPPATKEHTLDAEALRVLHLLRAELPASSAARLASAITGSPRKALYAVALAAGADADVDAVVNP